MGWFMDMKFKHFVISTFVFFLSCFGIWLFLFPDDVGNDISYESFINAEVQNENASEDFVQEVETSDNEEDIMKFNLVNDYQELDDGSFHDFNVDRVIPPVINALPAAEQQKLPLIIWWNNFTGEKGKIKRCFEGDCFFSVNKSYYDHELTKAFLFYGTDLTVDELPLPRKAHHEWGLIHEESPKNNGLFFYDDTMQMFNHTSTFKQQSSYPIPTQHIHSESYLLKPLKYTFEEKNTIKQDNNFSSIVYIQSGCNPPSDRDAYVQELMKYIKIDSYGKCLQNKDIDDKFKNSLTMHNKEFLDFLRQYKFMISFENAICDDYMTEKLFRTLNVGVIPIYKGAPNIKQWLPSNKSAIVVDDFDSPEELAKYIKYVDETPDEYNSYLSYKKTGIENKKLKTDLDTRQWAVNSMYRMSFITGFECHVCDRVHKNRKMNNSLRYQGSLEAYGCPKPTIYDYVSPKGTEDWERSVWSWSYIDAKNKAKEFKEKILNQSSR